MTPQGPGTSCNINMQIDKCLDLTFWWLVIRKPRTSLTWNCWNMKNPRFSWCRQWVMAHFWQHTPCQDQSSATYSPFLLFTQNRVESSTVVTNLWKCFWQNLLRCCDRISFLCTLEFGMCSLKCIGQVFSKLFEKTLNLMIVTAV